MSHRSSSLTPLPAAQRLALGYAPARARDATLGLLTLDARLAAVLRARREPIAVQLRLAWWRETLARPPAEWPRHEPALNALREWRDPSGLADLPVGWEALLADALTPPVIDDFVAGREHAFACLAGELGVAATTDVEAAARIWALADLAANVSDGEERSRVVKHGRDLVPPRLPASLRPLAVLAGLGAKALQLGGVPLLNGPGSTLLALRIGFTGR